MLQKNGIKHTFVNKHLGIIHQYSILVDYYQRQVLKGVAEIKKREK